MPGILEVVRKYLLNEGRREKKKEGGKEGRKKEKNKLMKVLPPLSSGPANIYLFSRFLKENRYHL